MSDAGELIATVPSGAAVASVGMPPGRMRRTTAAMTGLTALSRLTGFVRVLVVTAVLGRGALGDTYETANTVPNILFELFAAGALQAVLVPVLVDVLDHDGEPDAERVAGAVLGCLTALLAAIAAVAMVAAPLLMRVLTASGTDDAVRDAKVHLGTLFLWFFLPQLVFYGYGLVASAVLNAKNRFLVPVVAPAVNNLIVIAVYGTFQLIRGGDDPSLDLTTAEKLVLAGGTTLAVVVFTALPGLAVARSGFKLRPRLEWTHPTVRRLGRLGAWAGAYLALTQVLLLAVLVLANATPGGVVTFTFALAFFLLPYSLFAVPVAIARFPGLARFHQAGNHEAFGASLARGVRVTTVLLVPCAAALAALAWPIVRVATFGSARTGGLAPLAHSFVAFTPGLLGYGLVYLSTRAAYALGDARTPTIANGIGVAAGVVAMVIASAVVPLVDRPAALAGAYGGAATLSAVILGVAVARRLGADAVPVAGTIARVIAAGLVAGLAMAAVAAALDGRGRIAAAGTLVVAGAVGGAVYAGAVRLATGTSLRTLIVRDADG